jgi:hypothetical protein
MAKKVAPIRPSEVASEKKRTFPSAVLASFNELITQEFVSNSANIKQDDVVELMVKKGLDRKEIYDKGWLDVEDVYRAAGWHVKYDKPAYNETYPASFTFTRRSKHD